jgi:hypothetical protein
MTRIIVLFNLKPGVRPAVYEEWATRVDLPIVNRLRSIDGFEVFKSASLLGSTAPPPYQYIEVLDVNDMASFGVDIATATMQRVAAEFAALADATFILTEPVSAAAGVKGAAAEPPPHA